jgi:hypothetical protein
VLLDDGVLGLGQLARLAEDRVGDADLADVVKETRDVDRGDELRIGTDPAREEDSIPSDISEWRFV